MTALLITAYILGSGYGIYRAMLWLKDIEQEYNAGYFESAEEGEV